jgi:cyclopropane-fatty-acyl-phospholipid synthase
MVSELTTAFAKKLFLRSLEQLCDGYLELVCPAETYRFGKPESPLQAVIAVHDERFFRRAVFGGDIGVGEAYMDGQWSTPDLVALTRLGTRNLDQLEAGSRLTGVFNRAAEVLSHRRNRNTEAGSKKNIAYHYDLGNDFYRLFLDESMAYSCGYYRSPEDSLEAAQERKFDVICRKLQLDPQDRLLEIGTGWGGFAAYAAENYGCHVTTTTISRQQHDYAQELFSRRGLSGSRIDLQFEDYRNLRGRYNKIVSIEMFEAVGYEHYADYFGACDRLLTPDGSMLLQTITMQERKYDAYRKQSDWIRKHIFPGGELASVTEILRILAEKTRLQAFHLEDIGMHYALTLNAWRRRFLDSLGEVRSMGFDERFVRMWDYYLATCEGTFRERQVSNAQLLLSKTTNRNPLMNEPVMELEREECSQ